MTRLSSPDLVAPRSEHDLAPHFVIVGHSKSGTTALHDMLAQHSQVFMTRRKEPNFFATDLCSATIPGSFRQMTAAEYRDLFAEAPLNAICGESSASNLFSETAARTMAAWNPSMKLIAILREPVDFLQSYHQQMLKNPISDGESVKNFQRALGLEPLRQQGRKVPHGQQVPQLLYYSERVRYRSQIERLYEHFPAQQVLILIYDDFRRDNHAVLRQVCRFLEVDESFCFLPMERNSGVTVRSRKVQQALLALSHGRAGWRPIKNLVKTFLPSSIPRRAMAWTYQSIAFGPKSDIHHELKRSLKIRFHPEVVAISELLGRDLVHEWGYDSL
jgi:hypothetical protein